MKTKKITVRVTSQTAYHLQEMAEAMGVAPGRVIDELMKASRKETTRRK